MKVKPVLPTANKAVQPHETDPKAVRADLLAHGSPTREHIDPATGVVPEALYSGDGHDRMDADTIAAANRPQEK